MESLERGYTDPTKVELEKCPMATDDASIGKAQGQSCE
jgi:hypothetical protein